MWAPIPTMQTELSYAITTTMEESRTNGNDYAVKRQRDVRRTYVTTCGTHLPPAYTLVKETHTFEDAGKQNFALSNGMNSNWLRYTGQPPPTLECQYPTMPPPNLLPPLVPTSFLKSCLKAPKAKPPMFLDINRGYVMSVTPPAPTPSNPQSSFLMSVDAEHNRDGTNVNLNFFNLQSIITNSTDEEKEYGTNGHTMDLDEPEISNEVTFCDVGIQAGNFTDAKTSSVADSDGVPTPEPSTIITKTYGDIETQTPDLKGGHTLVDDHSEAEQMVSEYVNNCVNDFLKNIKSE